MSKFTVPLVIVASVGIAGAGWQTYQVASERQRVASLNQSLSDIEKRKAELEKEAARLRELNAVFQSESEQLRTKLAGKGTKGEDGKPSPIAEGADGFVPVETEGEQAKPEKKGFMNTMAKMMKDPEMRKAMRTQQAMGMQMMYGDLAKELGLPPEEAAKLMELLTDRQLAMSEKSMDLMGGAGGNADKLKEVGDSINQSREEYDKQIAEALGGDKYKQFQDYERSMGERFAVNQVQQQFTAKGMAMDDTARDSLMKIMTEERLNTPSSWDPSGKNAVEQMKLMQSDESMAKLMEQQKQTNLRVLDRASAFLSPDQMNQLRESQEQFLRMQEMGIKMGRQMMQGE